MPTVSPALQSFMLNLLVHTPVVIADIEDIIMRLEDDNAHHDTVKEITDALDGAKKVITDVATPTPAK